LNKGGLIGRLDYISEKNGYLDIRTIDNRFKIFAKIENHQIC
jgi:hypothetical protein